MDTKGFAGFFWGNAHAPAALLYFDPGKATISRKRPRASGPLLFFPPSVKKALHNAKNYAKIETITTKITPISGHPCQSMSSYGV